MHRNLGTFTPWRHSVYACFDWACYPEQTWGLGLTLHKQMHTHVPAHTSQRLRCIHTVSEQACRFSVYVQVRELAAKMAAEKQAQQAAEAAALVEHQAGTALALTPALLLLTLHVVAWAGQLSLASTAAQQAAVMPIAMQTSILARQICVITNDVEVPGKTPVHEHVGYTSDMCTRVSEAEQFSPVPVDANKTSLFLRQTFFSCMHLWLQAMWSSVHMICDGGHIILLGSTLFAAAHCSGCCFLCELSTFFATSLVKPHICNT